MMDADITRGPSLRRPGSRRRRGHLLISAFRILLTIEVRARRTSTPLLCQQMGVAFAGFTPPPGQPSGPLSRDIAEAWWAVESWLRWWPWARERACLRRSIALGGMIREMSPALMIDIVTSRPFSAHATLIVRGYQLDMGTAGQPLIGLSP